ncbi:hypothetical protein RvY_02257 [Ramazzottius varieornatus]|uniref:Uncharacterized protein n=1 Tax=Ramazzottius varieornatus TaxID=947166 RepID=A0A1D1UJ64_RAMVA|nr:hypothetical protein RvY_02257 [Ramazzottius varieornatus]
MAADNFFHYYRRRLLFFMVSTTCHLALLFSSWTIAQDSGSPSKSLNPAQLIFRDNKLLSPSLLIPLFGYIPSNSSYYPSYTTLPPTALRIAYDDDTSVAHATTPVFPPRIRLHNRIDSQPGETANRPHASVETTIRLRSVGLTTTPTSVGLVDEPRATLDLPRPINQEESPASNIVVRAVANAPPPHLQVLTSSTVHNETVYALSVSPATIATNSSKFDTRALEINSRIGSEPSPRILVQPAGSSSNSDSPYRVGSVTVGALIGIIAGILTTLVIATLLGIVCYRRRHPTWNAAETDLRILASHYGSYWDDKTLPNFQFNDKMIWPGESHEEMTALDNDAFLKSLEDLGRVSSRPSSKTNWNKEEDQRQSTKV